MKEQEDQDLLRWEPGSILDSGYGLSPRRVMTNPAISIGAKGWFAYIMSYAGNSDQAFPGRARQMTELNISKNTLTAYQKECLKAGLIRKEQVRTSKGRFKRNIYYIQYVPMIPAVLPCPKFTDTVKLRHGFGKGQLKPCPKLPAAVNLTPINNNRSFINNQDRSKNIITTPEGVEKERNKAAKRLLDKYHQLFNKEFGEDPPIKGGPEMKILASLIKAIGGPLPEAESKMSAILEKFIKSRDSFIVGNGHSIGSLNTKINAFILNQGNKGGGRGVTNLRAWAQGGDQANANQGAGNRSY